MLFIHYYLSVWTENGWNHLGFRSHKWITLPLTNITIIVDVCGLGISGRPFLHECESIYSVFCQGRWGKVRWVGSSVVEQSEIHKLGGFLICGSGPGVTWQAGRTHTLTHTHTQDTLRGFGPAQNWTPKPRQGGVHGHRRCCGGGPSYLSSLFVVSRRRKKFGRYLLPIERIQLISTLWNLGNHYDLEFAHYS